MGLIDHTRVHFDYEILETIEAGIVLFGTEVKSVRAKRGKLEGSHVVIRGGEAFLVGAEIPAFQQKNVVSGYEADRPRKLLLTARQIKELSHSSDKQGLTVVPLSMYNKGRNLKLSIALARGKKKFDKRETIKKRETERDINRTLKRL